MPRDFGTSLRQGWRHRVALPMGRVRRGVFGQFTLGPGRPAFFSFHAFPDLPKQLRWIMDFGALSLTFWRTECGGTPGFFSLLNTILESDEGS